MIFRTAPPLAYPLIQDMTTAPDILVIEDDAIMREAVAEWLEAAGYRVRTADDGNAGLAAVNAAAPALVVTDIYLPGTSGTVVIAELNQHHPGIPVIAISGLFESGLGISAARAVALGAARALAKPFTHGELLAAVAELLGSRASGRYRCVTAGAPPGAILASSRHAHLPGCHDRRQLSVRRRWGQHLPVLWRDSERVFYRGQAKQAEAPSVLLLAPVSTRPALESLEKMEHEYSLRSELDATWAVRPLALSQYNGQQVLVLEDPGGEPLDRLVQGPMEMRQFLRFAIGLATALSQLHKRELIHKDVKPPNVLVDSATGQVWLTGFGIASRLPRERQSPEPPEFIAGTLPYMAPEQTGRMNRSVDSRSDLYALGVTLYEMLTGSLPFTASDPMEWVHCHIARQPVPPDKQLKSVPGSVSAIIMKLLAKTAEERYQTAAGAESDLRRCLAEWEIQRRIDEFPPGEHDTPDRLMIPEKLYGRASEIDTLLASFDRIVAGGRPELVLVSGYSGIGKSSVVNELHTAACSAARPFCIGQVRPVQARHPLCHFSASLSEPYPPTSE